MSIHISIDNVTPMVPALNFDAPINWQINEGESWAVIGPNGAGKSVLMDILQKRIAIRTGEIKIDGTDSPTPIQSISFRDIYSPAQTRDSYYQQRWNSFNRDEMPMVREILSDFTAKQIDEYSSMGDIASMLDKRIIFLSSGELRKMFIFRMLLLRPKVIIIDNPFIGLDYRSRDLLCSMLHDMAKSGIICIMIVADHADIPEWTTHVLPLKNKHIFSPEKKEDFMSDKNLLDTLFSNEIPTEYHFPAPTNDDTSYENAIILKDINVHYGEKYILKGVNWTVKSGEKLALMGENGAGKSTLLSLVCGDNPQ
ncbi:MAG: ATP-binding cassette domain-containing protein, partial [Flavobacteriales bacterium]|nr:ATP-binding cassette domain-containing protein [Flavobacteriales bacterium]